MRSLSLLLVLTAGYLLSSTAASATARSFFAPTVDGQRIAFCVQFGEECGKPVADVWCRSQGFAEALLFQRDEAGGDELLYADTGELCVDKDCISFRQIKCWAG
jgi:hypothetical protein